jgi:hypothetical protein
MLSGAAKVRVKILDLDHSPGEMLRQLVISAASQRHREGVCGSTDIASEMLPAEKYVGEGGQGAIRPIGNPRPEHIVDRVSAYARRQAGHSAIPKIPSYPEPVAQVRGSRTAKTLAIRSTGVQPDVLITTEYFGLGAILSPDWYHHAEDKYSKNQ